MKRLAIIAQLKPGAAERAEELVTSGPPFDPRDVGFDRHSVFVSADQVVFVFEGGKLDQLLQTVVKNARQMGAFRKWEPLIEGLPRVAKEAYSWERGDDWPEDWGE
ncbi:MAG TPA: hypothetical protein VK915_04430 [Gaiellaceae bacterium]|nr:hypothetical protein [Gaiellaceae bacterium]